MRFSDRHQPQHTLRDITKIYVHEERITALTRGDIKLALGLVVRKSPAVIQGVCNPIVVEITRNVSMEIMGDILSLALM